ncbi:MAG: ribosomal protein S18-alanine N-acetyltransferase [Chloroflexi bacterium]|nr:ribosomal protein S18-alanine N-acetyltransferase [Chloroflexota bacterium]
MDSNIPYIVERMTLADVPEVAALEKMIFSMPWSAHAFEYELRYNPMAHFFVVRLKNPMRQIKEHDSPQEQKKESPRFSPEHKILGYGGLWLILDEAHICTLGVHPDWRRRGIGELLLTHLIDQAMRLNAAVLTLEVRVSNFAAQRLYQKYGFMAAGLRKRYYSDNNEDALIMTTELITSPSFQRRFRALKSALQQKLATQLTQPAL